MTPVIKKPSDIIQMSITNPFYTPDTDLTSIMDLRQLTSYQSCLSSGLLFMITNRNKKREREKRKWTIPKSFSHFKCLTIFLYIKLTKKLYNQFQLSDLNAWDEIIYVEL